MRLFLYVAILLLFFGCAQKVIKRAVPPGYAALARYRTQVFMIPLLRDTALERAATFHARYLAINKTSGHSESASLDGFCGESAGKRAMRCGYATYDVIENIAYGVDARRAVDMLFATLYHRIGFLDWGIDEVGIGYDEDAKITVFDMGNSSIRRACRKADARSGKVIMNVCAKPLEYSRYQEMRAINYKKNPPILFWPPSNVHVPPYAYPETPAYTSYALSGYPVTIRFNPALFSQPITLISFELYDESGKPVEILQTLTAKNDPNHILSPYDFALIPVVLEWGRRYKAVFRYRYEAKAHRVLWYFSTRKTPRNFLIAKKKSQFVISPGKEYRLFWMPQNPNDRIRTFRYYCSRQMRVEASMSDINTIALRVDGVRGEQIKIVLDNEEVITLRLE